MKETAKELMDKIKIKQLIKLGHTHHCAYRQVWGDGECECRRRKDGTYDNGHDRE